MFLMREDDREELRDTNLKSVLWIWIVVLLVDK